MSLSKLYVVWGPTAEWADGSGPLFYTNDARSARDYIRSEMETTLDYVADGSTQRVDTYATARILAGWPYDQVDYSIQVYKGEELARLLAHNDLTSADTETILEALNQ